MIQEEDKRRSIRITDHELEAEERRGDKVEKCEREKVLGQLKPALLFVAGRRSGKQVGSGSLKKKGKARGDFSHLLCLISAYRAGLDMPQKETRLLFEID